MLGAIALLQQRLGQTPCQLLAPLPYGAGEVFQSGFRCFHLLLQGVEPLIEPLVQLLPELCLLLLLSYLCQRNNCGRSHQGLLSILGRVPQMRSAATNLVKSLA